MAPCPFTYMAYVCDTVVRQARGMNVPVPRVVFSTDDMRSAYQQVPLSDPEMCIVCIYCFDSGNVGPRFVENWGHNFGHTSSVSNYWRTPLLCCQAARHFLAIPVDHYCDDYVTPDFALASLLGISQAAISQWGDRVPENRVWQLKVLKPEWFKDFSQTVSMN